ncbi:MAG: hypothetical protein Q8R90_09100 [Bacteroidales bacterium]|jgi:hypothetical protein|nr:hypothetical protein [Bacteroidales bacterium]
MNKSIVTEIVSFEIDESISNEAFKEIVESVEIEFHMLQSGYIDSELVKGINNSWTMIMHWDSLEEVKLASKLLMKSEKSKLFRDAIIPSTVRMSYLKQIKTWSR